MNPINFYLIVLFLGIFIGGIIAAGLLRSLFRWAGPSSYPVYSYSGYGGPAAGNRTGLTLAILLGFGMLFFIGFQRNTVTETSSIIPAAKRTMQFHPSLDHKLKRARKEKLPMDSNDQTASIPPSASLDPILETNKSSFLYVQIDAFKHLDNARAACRNRQKKLKTLVTLAIDPQSSVPYKVLAGPFDSYADARSFLRRTTCGAFPSLLIGSIQLHPVDEKPPLPVPNIELTT